MPKSRQNKRSMMRSRDRRHPSTGSAGVSRLDLGSALIRELEMRIASGSEVEATQLLAAIGVIDRSSPAQADQTPFPMFAWNDQPAQSIIASLFQKAVERQNAGDLVDAEAIYRAILVLDASHAMVWSNLADILIKSDKADVAVAACHKALDLEPDHFNAKLNLAKAHDRMGALHEVVDILRSVVARYPQRVDLRRSLAEALARANLLGEAIDQYDRMLIADPDNAEDLFGKAQALQALGEIDPAIACFADVCRLQPDNALAYSNRGILMAMHSLSNDLDEAANLCLQAATLRPDHPPVINNLAIVLQLRSETENALLLFRQLIVDHPMFAPAHSNLGSILSQKNLFDDAEDAFLQALALDPTLKEPRIELIKVRRHLCNWEQDIADRQAICDLNGLDANFLIVFMAMATSARDVLTYARAAMPKYNASMARAGRHTNKFDPERLRIGYISADFKDHPVGHLVPDLIALHQRARFEVFGYSLGPGDGSRLRWRLAASFDRFTDLNKLSDAEAAAKILADEVDILIDLTGPTAGGRFAIMSLRPAPIQVSFLGLPGTTGADCIDYIIADAFLVPPGQECFYHEQVVRLPLCYQPGDTSRATLVPRPSRADCGLPENGFVFCSFNSPVKISPDVFDIWMRLLESVEGSVLWLYCKAEKAKINLLARARQRGISADRIVFAGPLPYDMYLTRMTCADLFLDTFPYAAGATCNDALWVGLPVLTCVGETYVSRMGGSLLKTLGMPDLVTHSLPDYEQRALDLARSPDELGALKARLLDGKAKSPLFDMSRFTRALEDGYQRMAQKARVGEAPVGFDIDDLAL